MSFRRWFNLSDQKNLIVFDLDGTLFDISYRYIISYIIALNKTNISWRKGGEKKILKMRKSGMSGLQIFKNLIPDIEEPLLIEVNELRKKIVNEDLLLNIDYPIHGLEIFLKNLKKNEFRLAVLTARQTIESVEKQLEKFLLLHYFDKIIVKQSTNCVEAKKAGLIEILAEYELEPKNAIFIGDTECDIEAGYKVGLYTIGVLSGLSSRRLLEKANIILEDVTKLAIV